MRVSEGKEITFGEKIVSLNGELRVLRSKLDEKESELQHAMDQAAGFREEKVCGYAI